MRHRMTVTVLFLLGFLSIQAVSEGQDIYFSVSPADHTVVEGLSVHIRCEAEPNSLIKYSWKFDGQPLAPNPRRHLVNGNLHITRVNRLLDSGNFICVATHKQTGVSIESSTAKLNIQWISEASVQLQLPKLPTLIQPGMNIELRCHVDGSGELKYEWFRNAESLSKNEHLEMKKNKLYLKNASPEDNGIYSCLARNEAGSSPFAESFPLIISGNETATIKLPPENVIVKRGDQAAFTCLFENAEAVQWYFKKIGPIDSDDDKTIFDNGTLLINSAEHRDQGFYSCHGNRGETTQIYTAELQIAYLKNLTSASFEPSLSNQMAIVGVEQELQVSCLVPEGIPPPKVFWRDPEGHIVSDSGPVRVQDNTLIVAKARVGTDNGNYTCVAENMAGQTEIALHVIVSTPPTLKHSPQSVTVLEDNPLHLVCSYDGNEPPITTSRWLKDGEPLRELGGPMRYRVTELHGNVTLSVKNAYLSDRGVYACEIFTQGFPPIYSESANVTIEEKLKFSPAPVDKILELNSTARVSCKAQGSTLPSVKWHKQNLETFPKHIQDVNGTLHFNGVLEEDKGNYTCVATNSQGTISHTIKIGVVIAPKFTVKPTNPSVAIEGSPIILHCAAEGDPKPTIQWDKDSRMNSPELDSPRFKLLPNGSLFINEVYLMDEGKYGCTAGNMGGLKREEVELIVREVEGYRPDMDLDTADDGSMMTKTVTITLSAAAAYMVLVVGLMVYCRYRRRRRKQQCLQEQDEGQEKMEGGELQEEQCEMKETNIKAKKTKESRESQKSDGAETAQSQSSNHSKKSKTSYDKITISRSHLRDLKPLGRGEFGEVFSTKYQPDGEKESLVMVKTLTNTKDENALHEFKRHLDLLQKLNHENVAKLIGLCREMEPDYMVLEHTDWGDFKQYLLASKQDGTANPSPNHEPKRTPQLSVTQIISLTNQAARGLKHLADHRLVHKDVATRNCLISSNLVLKISMSCMTKEPYHQEYTKHRNQVIPLRWLPYEAVYEDEYSTKSDIYSFSCLVWEIFHQGELPFNKLNDDSILTQIKSQTLTWKAHKATPAALQELQKLCWAHDPRERPTFDQVVTKIGELVVDSCL